MATLFQRKEVWWINININKKRIRKPIGRDRIFASKLLSSLIQMKETDAAVKFLRELRNDGLLTEQQKISLDKYIDADYKDLSDGQSIQAIMLYKELKRKN